jgi:hypothetical protein
VSALEERDFIIAVYNLGKQMAEDVEVLAFFPPEFKFVVFAPGITGQQPTNTTLGDHLGYNTVSGSFGHIHEDVILTLYPARLKAPSKPETYTIDVYVWEKKLGKTRHQLTVEVV